MGDGTLTHESKDSFSVGDKVTVKCSDGSEVKYGTEDEAFCTDSGKFTVDQLVCVRPEGTKSNYLKFSYFKILFIYSVKLSFSFTSV